MPTVLRAPAPSHPILMPVLNEDGWKTKAALGSPDTYGNQDGLLDALGLRARFVLFQVVVNDPSGVVGTDVRTWKLGNERNAIVHAERRLRAHHLPLVVGARCIVQKAAIVSRDLALSARHHHHQGQKQAAFPQTRSVHDAHPSNGSALSGRRWRVRGDAAGSCRAAPAAC